jgi:hypothetical protein
VQAEREGRIIILYHVIAMAVIAIETYMVTGILKMSRATERPLMPPSRLLYRQHVYGLGFAYFGTAARCMGSLSDSLTLIFWPACCWSSRCGRGAGIPPGGSGLCRTKGGVDWNAWPSSPPR